MVATELRQLTGLRPAQAPEFSVTASLDWMSPLGVGVYVDVRYESDRFDDDLNTRTLGAAVTVDMRVDYELGSGVSVYAGRTICSTSTSRQVRRPMGSTHTVRRSVPARVRHSDSEKENGARGTTRAIS
jgi:hypothetical protein